MKTQARKHLQEIQSRVVDERDPYKLLDMLLALDRMVVELSMRKYNISRRDRFRMRAQNKRLHQAVRKHLPQLLESSSTPA